MIYINVDDIDCSGNRIKFDIATTYGRFSAKITYPEDKTIYFTEEVKDAVLSSLISLQAFDMQAEINVPFLLSREKLEFWRGVYNHFYAENRMISENMNGHPLRFTESLSLKCDNEIKAEPPVELGKRKHCLIFGGGKESLLTLGLLGDIFGKTAVEVDMVNLAHWTWSMYKESFDKLKEMGYECNKVWSNINRMNDLVKKVSKYGNQFDIQETPKYNSNIRGYWDIQSVMNYVFFILPIVKTQNIWWGIDYTGGEKFMQAPFNKVFAPRKLHSFVAGFYEILSQKYLYQIYPDLQMLQKGCFRGKGKSDSCSRCGKCLHYWLFSVILDMPMRKKFDEQKIMRNKYLQNWLNGANLFSNGLKITSDNKLIPEDTIEIHHYLALAKDKNNSFLSDLLKDVPLQKYSEVEEIKLEEYKDMPKEYFDAFMKILNTKQERIVAT